jgi:apolipoprotein N-acyltransferase
MAGKRKKKKGLIVLIVVLVILVAAIWAGKTFVYDKAKEKVTLAVAEKMIEEQVQNDSTGQLQNAQDIYNSMSEEDKQTVNDMIESKVSPQTISDVSKYAKDQDKEGLKQYVKEKFTESEIRQMKDLYNKYK